MSKVVFKVGDGYVDANGKPVKEDGTPIGTPPQAQPDAAKVTELEGQVQALTQERGTLQAKVTELEGQPRLPADARERLVKVRGINETLADVALAALQAE